MSLSNFPLSWTDNNPSLKRQVSCTTALDGLTDVFFESFPWHFKHLQTIVRVYHSDESNDFDNVWNVRGWDCMRLYRHASSLVGWCPQVKAMFDMINKVAAALGKRLGRLGFTWLTIWRWERVSSRFRLYCFWFRMGRLNLCIYIYILYMSYNSLYNIVNLLFTSLWSYIIPCLQIPSVHTRSYPRHVFSLASQYFSRSCGWTTALQFEYVAKNTNALVNGFHAIGPDRVWNWAWKLNPSMLTWRCSTSFLSDRLFFHPLGHGRKKKKSLKKCANKRSTLHPWTLGS